MVLLSALRRVIKHNSAVSLPSVPSNNLKTGYGPIQLQKTAFLFDLVDIDATDMHMVESKNPLSMESVDQVFKNLNFTLSGV